MNVSDLAEALGSTADLRDESWQVRQTLSALGRLLGASLAEPRRDLRTFVAEHLHAPLGDVSVVTRRLRGANAALVQVELARLLDAVPGAVLADDTGTASPGYELVAVDVDEQVAAPFDLAAYVPAPQVFPFDAVIVLTEPRDVAFVRLHVRTADLDAAREALGQLIHRATSEHNFYRGKTLVAKADDWSLQLTPVLPATTVRADLIHPSTVWAEIDANVAGLARHRDALVAAGLGASRGLLVVGPPGVGKTALCRVIAGEFPPGTTIVIVDAAVTAKGLSSLYDALEELSPAAVFLDDIDLMAGNRRAGSGGAQLGEFLARLDGFTPSSSVVTVATTNAADALDPALIRAGRFDAVIEIGPPGPDARAEILARYLAPITPMSVEDVRPVAAAAGGASGADLREIVRRAVLEYGRQLTVRNLQEIVRTGRWKPAAPTGQYL